MSIDLNTLTPDQVATLPAAERKRVILRCSALIQGAASADEEVAPGTILDRLLNIQEVAERMGIAVSTAQHRRFPFRVRGTRMYSERGMLDFIRKRQG